MSTPAKRAQARRDPALRAPRPIALGASRPVRFVTMTIGRRRVQIGAALIVGSSWEFTREGAATITLRLHDPEGRLVALVADEQVMLAGEVRIVLGDIAYVLMSVDADEDASLTMVFEDWAAWRMRQYRRFMAADRRTVTRAGFVRRMAREAGVRAYIPELHDVQPVRGGG